MYNTKIKDFFLKISDKKAIICIILVGILVFIWSIHNPFVLDDHNQILNNPNVHSLSHLSEIFSGDTFYNTYNQVSEGFFRPLMSLWYAFIYIFFGANTTPFHLLQIALHITVCVLLYFFFKHFFKSTLALLFALIFLVHPINSMTVFAIMNIQEPLFMFFGLLAMLLLFRYESIKIYPLVGTLLLLSILSKETGLLFLATSALYILIVNRNKLIYYLLFTLPLAAFYLFYRIEVINVAINNQGANIGYIPFIGRLINMPSLITFYLFKFLMPIDLARGYYWVHDKINFVHFIFPLIVIVSLIVLTFLGAKRIKQKESIYVFWAFIFFTFWFLVGMLPHLQIITLDMTAADTWFYFAMIGLMGMMGIFFQTLKIKRKSQFLLLIVCISLIAGLSARTVVRGTDWSNEYKLAASNIRGSKEDPSALHILAIFNSSQNNHTQAIDYAERAVNVIPDANTISTLGLVTARAGRCEEALRIYKTVISDNDIKLLNHIFLENTSTLILMCGNYNIDRPVIMQAISQYPKDGNLWISLAVLDYLTGRKAVAQFEAQKAKSLNAKHYPDAYDAIMASKPYTKPSRNISINIPD